MNLIGVSLLRQENDYIIFKLRNAGFPNLEISFMNIKGGVTNKISFSLTKNALFELKSLFQRGAATNFTLDTEDIFKPENVKEEKLPEGFPYGVWIEPEEGNCI